MKVVIFAGGFGTRISEESVFKPKPMIEIGGKPILWHIMKYYSSFGHNDFIILSGYKQEIIKQYFKNYFTNHADISFNFAKNGDCVIHQTNCEPWNVTVLDTGLNTMTGGRLKRAQKYIGKEPFMLTYGDGLSNVDLNELLEQHKKSKAMVTLTACHPEPRFGELIIDDQNMITSFKEKPKQTSQWINGGFFVCEPSVFDYIAGDEISWENEPLRQITAEGKLYAYRHEGFWKPMDTLKDKTTLETILKEGKAPWIVWH